jgi:flavin reductase (DIM6/NTAB) family NADH-FMN oxidoreductase RutF
MAMKPLPLSEVFGLTQTAAVEVGAPLVAECYANLECRVADTRMVADYNFFILKVIKAWIDPAVENPRTIHHLGKGKFMVGGNIIQLKSHMK